MDAIVAHINVHILGVLNYTGQSRRGTNVLNECSSRHPCSLTNQRWPALMALSFLAIVGFAQQSLATSIMIARTESRIVVAADSKHSSGTSPVCKIRPCGPNALVVVAGGVMLPIKKESNVRWLDAIKVLTETCSAPRELGDYAAYFGRLVSNQIPSGSALEMPGMPKSQTFVLSAVFFGIENRRAAFKIANVMLNPHGTTRPILQECPGHFCPNAEKGIIFVPLGFTTAYEEFAASPEIRLPINDIEVPIIVTKIVERQAQMNPEAVGGPIDVVSIDSEGAEWLERKKECQDIPEGLRKPTLFEKVWRSFSGGCQ
jgi:hypothetical protein